MADLEWVEDIVNTHAMEAISDNRDIRVGADLVSISRVERALQADGFRTRYFTSAERRYCEGKQSPSRHFAARWAAKEAVAKALPGAIGISHALVSVQRTSDGVSVEYPKELENPPWTELTIAHDDDFNAALAFAVLGLDI